jgi:hypothetical protein
MLQLLRDTFMPVLASSGEAELWPLLVLGLLIGGAILRRQSDD